MAITMYENRQIYEFVNDENRNNLHTVDPALAGGPCAGLVKNLIEEATGKRIQLSMSVFRNYFSGTEENLVAIRSYDDLAANCNNGDILVVVDNNGVSRHYMLFCNALTPNGAKHCLGINGYIGQTMVPFKGVQASEIVAGDFVNGFFMYNDSNRNKLYKIDYDLV